MELKPRPCSLPRVVLAVVVASTCYSVGIDPQSQLPPATAGGTDKFQAMKQIFRFQICVLVASCFLGGANPGHVGVPDQGSREVRVFNWSGFIGARTLSDFERRFSAKVTYETYNSNEELYAKLKAGTGYDVVFPSTYMVQILIREGFLLPLDKSRLKNIRHLSRRFLDRPFDPENRFSLPYLWGTTGLGVNLDHLGRKPIDLDLLFRAEYQGRISMLEGMRFTIGIALKHLGFSVNTTQAAELTKAERLLISQRPLVKAYTDSYLDMLASGAVWVSYCYSGDTYQLSRKQASIRYEVPPNGTIIGIDSFCIPKGARNPELAHTFINYLLEPEVAASVSTELLYATPNEASRRFMKARLLDDPAIYPPESVIKKSDVLLDLGGFTRAYEEAWARIRGHQKN